MQIPFAVIKLSYVRSEVTARSSRAVGKENGVFHRVSNTTGSVPSRPGQNGKGKIARGASEPLIIANAYALSRAVKEAASEIKGTGGRKQE